MNSCLLTYVNVNEAEKASTVAEEMTEPCLDDTQAGRAAKTKEAEKAVKDFICSICDFQSNWENGLQIHMSRKHNNIDQMDGNNSSVEIDDDQKYSKTDHYWKTGKLGTIFQSFLDANDLIEKSNLEEEVKSKEKQKILQARKHAFGNDFRHFPPWK